MKIFSTDTIKCPHRFECQGCQSWDINYLDQLEHKKLDLKKKLNNTEITIHVKTAGSGFLRTRFDFTIEHQKLGLYGANSKLVDLTTCFQLDPSLNEAFQELRMIHWPIQKGSVRVRVSPEKKWGLWLDLANLDIKKLLIEKNLLIQLSEKFFIEIGQKKKTLDLNSFHKEQLKLMDPYPQPWFQSQGYPLYCSVGSFTQPSWKSAELINDVIIDWLDLIFNSINESNVNPMEFIEYGAGIGQYSRIFQNYSVNLNIFETEFSALSVLEKNLDFLKSRNKMNPNFSFIINPSFLDRKNIYLALVNPPRSGLMSFVKTIMLREPEWIIYISCSVQSLCQDLEILKESYQIKKVTLVDQFPQTNHYETMVLLQRINP